MDPVGFEIEQTAFLPPHDEVVYAKDGQPDETGQPRYRPLPVVRFRGDTGRCISRWTFTAEKRKAIAAGEDLYLEQLTFNKPLQPILPTVRLRDFCSMDRPN